MIPDLPPLSFWPWYAVKASFWIGLGLLMAYCLVTPG